MTKKNVIKFITLVMLIAVLMSIFSLPAFAEEGLSEGAQEDEEMPWWEQVAMFICYVIFIVLAIPIHIIVGIYSIIKELIPMIAEFWESIF